jgi:hypothetical protein
MDLWHAVLAGKVTYKRAQQRPGCRQQRRLVFAGVIWVTAYKFSGVTPVPKPPWYWPMLQNQPPATNNGTIYRHSASLAAINGIKLQFQHGAGFL